MDMRECVVNEMAKMEQARDALMEHPKIRPLLAAVSQHTEETQGRPITVHEKRNIAQCLYNAIVEAGMKQNVKG